MPLIEATNSMIKLISSSKIAFWAKKGTVIPTQYKSEHSPKIEKKTYIQLVVIMAINYVRFRVGY